MLFDLRDMRRENNDQSRRHRRHQTRRVELVSFMKARGIELQQVGENYRGFCPFHEDTTPSLTVNPKENLWNCFWLWARAAM
ncbi:MAG: hypothetical protein JKP90_10135 [Desulfofustis sp. PB-SRB1]|nr:hypothetical protein [Desulfofustis sp. PB-SRB1]